MEDFMNFNIDIVLSDDDDNLNLDAGVMVELPDNLNDDQADKLIRELARIVADHIRARFPQANDVTICT
jgi:hypothetical protein